MDEKYKATLKSAETEDWLDLHVIRPACYYLAVFFAKFDIHPNTVTIWSMIIGAASAVFYGCASYYYCGWNGLMLNIVAIVMLMIADILDCTDGQLARMTGKKSPLGRILDGAAGFTWFVPIYTAMTWRFYQHHELEFSWLGISDTPQNALIATAVVLVLAVLSGFEGMGRQQRMADYFIQVHLFFLKGEKGSELDNSERQRQLYDELPKDAPWYEREFQKSYVGYTRKQEHATPKFQRLMGLLKEKFGSASAMPEQVRREFHDSSLRIITLNGLLTFNFRSFWFFLFCLLDVPVLNFLFEIIVMGLLCHYVIHRYERLSSRIADKL
jgi:hypothetical protein